MRKSLALASVATLLCLTTISPAQTTNPWDGTYKLDINKSHLAGDTIAFTKTPDGMWHFIDGANTYNFIPDGKPYSLGGTDRTQSITMPDPHTMDVLIQVKGKTVVTLRNAVISTEAHLRNAVISTEAHLRNAVISTEAKRSGETPVFVFAFAVASFSPSS